MNHRPRGKSLRRSRLHAAFSCISPNVATGCIPVLLFEVRSFILSRKNSPFKYRRECVLTANHCRPIDLRKQQRKNAATTHRCLIMRSETWSRDQPSPIDRPWNTEEPSRRMQHTLASPGDRLLDPSHDSTPNAAFPTPPDPIGNGRYCIGYESHRLRGFLQPCEVALGLGRHRR